jgi:flavin reductase (DIM6/NTAB) family NADH-FMN oxidoreductase RutF
MRLASDDTARRHGHEIAPSERRRLRAAFGRFTTGVTVITTRRDVQAWAAITVNSFTSVSLDPPLLLFGLARTSNSCAAFEHCKRFAVSVLRHDQQWISTNFARPSSSRWGDVPKVHEGADDLLIGGALATFRCERKSSSAAGDHLLVIGEVTDFAYLSNARPLTFFQASYGSFTPDQAATVPVPHNDSMPVEFTLGWG